MNVDHNNLVAAALIHSEDYARAVLPHLNEEYFESRDLQWFLRTFHDYFEEHDAIPTKEVFEIEVQSNTTLNSDEVDNLEDRLSNIYQDKWHKAVQGVSRQWLIDTTEKWCRDRALYNAIRKSLDAVEQVREGQTNPEWVPQMFEDALSVSFEGTDTHDFFDNADERFEFYHQPLRRIPFPLDSISRSVRGGLPRKALGVYVAPTGVGKTTMLTQSAATMLMQSYNVLYVTLEISEEYISQRVETTLFDKNIDEVEMLEYKKYRSKIDQLREQTQGRLKVREFPPSTITATTLKNLLHDLRVKDQFEPDVMIVDYLNLLSTGRAGKSDNSYTTMKKVAEDARALGVRHDMLVLSATQTNRDGQNAADFELNEVSESHGVSMTADWMGALISTEELEKMNQLTFKQLKNRFGSLSPRAWRIGIQRDKFKVYDVDSVTQEDEKYDHHQLNTDNENKSTELPMLKV